MSADILEIIPTALRNLMNVREVVRDERKGCHRVVLEPNLDILTIHGELHGGYISAITMIAAEVAAATLLSEEEALVVIGHNISFLKHAEAVNEVELESCVVSKGEKVIHIETRVRVDTEEIARSITSFIAEKA